ncbi:MULTISPECIES: hypothetical protein [unclassified Streptomyces]|uniref:hypothetical protein n=1 Tax=unclassified Streptomyces TaxID=2593676 RepID=UPI0023652AEF|nr:MULTISPECIES: hypothetical protein [unclassified Streptomyces]MDF3144241.1 hypothetical protein [Streptomyces sp. T21Q-yed]WDF39109.1 hypothetical protein PBV52_21060 [Streptomyces sp. T12]
MLAHALVPSLKDLLTVIGPQEKSRASQILPVVFFQEPMVMMALPQSSAWFLVRVVLTVFTLSLVPVTDVHLDPLLPGLPVQPLPEACCD